MAFKRKLLMTVLAVLCILGYDQDENTSSTSIASAEKNHTAVKPNTGLGMWVFTPR